MQLYGDLMTAAGIFAVPVVAKAHRDAGAVVHNSLPHLKELLHHQPSQVMASLVC